MTPSCALNFDTVIDTFRKLSSIVEVGPLSYYYDVERRLLTGSLEKGDNICISRNVAQPPVSPQQEVTWRWLRKVGNTLRSYGGPRWDGVEQRKQARLTCKMSFDLYKANSKSKNGKFIESLNCGIVKGEQ